MAELHGIEGASAPASMVKVCGSTIDSEAYVLRLAWLAPLPPAAPPPKKKLSILFQSI